MGAQIGYVLEFGSFRIDPASRRLLRDAEVVPIKSKVFDTLLLLVESAGRVVTKDQLMQAIWPDTVVEENNLTQNIYTLRKVLGERPDEHRYIVTVPGQGYRFVADLRREDESADLVVEKHTFAHIVAEEEIATIGRGEIAQSFEQKVLPFGAGQPRARSKWPATFLLKALLLTASTAAVIFWRPSQDSKISKAPVRLTANFMKLTDNVALDDQPDWSPDGSRIVFVTNRDGKKEIYVMNADGSNQVNFSKHPGHDDSPAWSPDGEKIAFQSERDGGGLFVMNVDGTNPIKIAPFGARAAWSPGSNKILFGATPHGRRWPEIYVVNNDGTRLMQLTDNPGFNGDPAWSPDAKRIAFTTFRDGNAEIYVMNADGTNQTRLTRCAGYVYAAVPFGL